MPGLTVTESEECQKRFQAAVDVIHNLPKNGYYRPSYEVMLRFYGLYKQAVCGPCTTSRPGFWDPVGRYKWDAWNQLGDMSKESAMAEYVEEMKKVAQEVIDTMPMNEKTASFFHYFEPLYLVIHDMPRPPEELLSRRADVNDNEQMVSPAESEVEQRNQEETVHEQEGTERIPHSESADLSPSEGLVLTSDSESEIYCDTVEQLDNIKVIQVGAGKGGEGAENGRGHPSRRRETGREGMRQGWREPQGGMPHRSARRAERSALGGGGGGGGDDSERGGERLQDAEVQQQIVLALRRLREDMHSVMERLEVVEGLAAANAQNSEWRSRLQLVPPEAEEESWWPFDVSGRMMLLLLVWPFIAQGLVFLLQWRKKKSHVSS